MKILKIILFVQLFFLASSCAVGPVTGIIFTQTAFSGEFNPANDVKFQKEASSCMHQFLGLVTLGTAGAGKIALNNGIKRIALVDHSNLSVFQILYARYCTHVYGE